MISTLSIMYLTVALMTMTGMAYALSTDNIRESTKRAIERCGGDPDKALSASNIFFQVAYMFVILAGGIGWPVVLFMVIRKTRAV